MFLENHSDVMLATSSIMPSLLSNKWLASGIIIKSLDLEFVGCCSAILFNSIVSLESFSPTINRVEALRFFRASESAKSGLPPLETMAYILWEGEFELDASLDTAGVESVRVGLTKACLE